LKYYRVTGKTDKKEPYVPDKARMRTAEHARHFIASRESQTNYLAEIFTIKPVITALYDAELFGHWWYEGPAWIEFVLRGIHSGRRNFRTITPLEYLSLQGQNCSASEKCDPTMSSWGERGYSEVWLNIANDYLYRHIHKVTERMIYLANRFTNARGILKRALNQAVREMLLAQQSDWAFIMKHETSISYAQKRFEEHVSRFNILFESIISENISKPWLSEIEEKDRIFQDMDYRIFCSKED
jgi:1,4-alpha-glucan branching enzyme